MAFVDGQDAPADNSKFFKFESKGDTITGHITKIVDSNKFDKPEIELSVNGEPKVVGLATDLARKFRGTFGSLAKTPIGALVEITLTGKKDVGQPQKMKVFSLRVDTDTLPPGFILNPEPEDDDEGGF